MQLLSPFIDREPLLRPTDKTHPIGIYGESPDASSNPDLHRGAVVATDDRPTFGDELVDKILRGHGYLE